MRETSGTYAYIGNCISGLEDEQFQSDVCEDPTEMAQMIESSVDLSKDQFLKNVIDVPFEITDDFEFGYNERYDVMWAWDTDDDIHYFFIS